MGSVTTPSRHPTQPPEMARDILQCIGNTSLVALRAVAPANGARILLKVESENPTGSMKDRMALAMIEAAESDGRLPAGGAVVEYTAGSTGVSLSLVCAVKGHPLHIVSSDAFTRPSRSRANTRGSRSPARIASRIANPLNPVISLRT